jgi:mersacidin/lichenicidin family type 2 lantibiotic
MIGAKKFLSKEEIIRAWKDEEYCENLTQEQRLQLPKHPAGLVELCDRDMEVIVGGAVNIISQGNCQINSANSGICVDRVEGGFSSQTDLSFDFKYDLDD